MTDLAAYELRMPYDGRRGEVLVAVDEKRALWRLGGVPTMRKRVWVITDHEGRMTDDYPVGFQRESLALEAWNAHLEAASRHGS